MSIKTRKTHKISETIEQTLKELKLRYKTPAERTNEGWEKYSLPIGNGYGGASVFGGVDEERVQFTTNAFANTFRMGGVSNFLELYIDFNDKARDYERSLDLRTGIAYSEYLSDFGKTERKAFFCYPDNVFIYRTEFSKPSFLPTFLSFTLAVIFPPRLSFAADNSNSEYPNSVYDSP